MMRKPITRNCEWLCANIGGNIKYIYIFRESKNPNPSRSFVLRWADTLLPALLLNAFGSLIDLMSLGRV